ncbi:uncharacterized protein LOC129615458 isoform X2 [Condylostylus longicornis]|uniref:uncharacterized protein LOC129615458 isoform X2 n=1 Tax=Condylostylus longicornis TaxID=2530218 RepID=UPI00244E47D0|nr:uncharacterized protein LOC129615458 isoform X2 [Condylostylus longicornis]
MEIDDTSELRRILGNLCDEKGIFFKVSDDDDSDNNSNSDDDCGSESGSSLSDSSSDNIIDFVKYLFDGSARSGITDSIYIDGVSQKVSNNFRNDSLINF